MSEITPELEAVARAINAADTRARLGAVASRVDMSRNYLERRDACIAMARAALSAIREPTERMAIASGRIVHARDSEIFMAMIDSILSDTRTPTEGDLL